MGKIAFLGDSVTKGTDYGGVTSAQTFASLIGVANGYSTADIINAGVGGNNSAQALARLDTDVISQAPDVCAIMLGNNDCRGSNSLPPATMAENIRQIIVNLRAANIKPVVFSMGFERGTTSVIGSYVTYLRALDNVVASEKVDYVDVYREFAVTNLYLDSTIWIAMFADSLHLASSGHQYIADFAARQRFSGVFLADTTTPPPTTNTDEPLAKAIADYLLLGATSERIGEISTIRSQMTSV